MQPTLITKDHSGSHVSAFLMISGGGMMVFPIAILHGPPEQFADVDESSFVRCFATKKGYMTKASFLQVMSSVFIPLNDIRISHQECWHSLQV